MNEPKVSVKAIVTLTVEVQTDAWDGDCKMSQVSQQARESAIALLTQMPGGGTERHRLVELLRRCRIVGVPMVKAVAVEEER